MEKLQFDDNAEYSNLQTSGSRIYSTVFNCLGSVLSIAFSVVVSTEYSSVALKMFAVTCCCVPINKVFGIFMSSTDKSAKEHSNHSIHLHQLYFVKVTLLLLCHLLMLVIYPNTFLVWFGEITLSIANASVTDVYSKTNQMVIYTIIFSVHHTALFGISCLELLYYSFQWMRRANTGSNMEGQSNGCKTCSDFKKTCLLVAGITSHLSI